MRVLLLALSLFVSQHAAIVHALSHLSALAVAAADAGQDGDTQGERLSHRCHECLAYSALDVPVAAAHRRGPAEAVAALGYSAPLGGVVAAQPDHFDSRAPPHSL